MSYLLLKDKDSCPQCRCKGRVVHFTRCHNCGTMLFVHAINFHQYEEDGNFRTYWLWTEARGWISRDYVMNPMEKPQERIYMEEKLPEDYGRHTTPEKVATHKRKKSVLP